MKKGIGENSLQIVQFWLEKTILSKVHHPKELGDAAVGNPITFLIMIIVGAVIAKAGAVAAVCISLIGAGFSSLNIIEGWKWYDAIKARKEGTATKEQIEILDRGHWKE